MSSFFHDVKKIPRKSLLNVYGLFIAKCRNLTHLSTIDEKVIHQIEKEVKILFMNHEKNLATMGFIIKLALNEYKSSISLNLQNFLGDVVESIESSELKSYYHIDSDEIDMSCLRMDLGRRFESEIVIQMLLNPSDKMLDAVQAISNKIIHILEQIDKKFVNDSLLVGLGPDDKDSDLPYYAFAFGRFKDTPTFAEVIKVLKENKNVPTVMLIHFLFMRNIFPELKFQREFEERALHTHYSGDLCLAMDNGTIKNYSELVSFFCRYPDYAPHLYTDRGREKFVSYASNRLGIMLDDQPHANLPVLDATWYPDCLCNVVDLKSEYVKKLICNYGIPYIAGPSGMTSIFMGLLTFLGDIENKIDTSYYILAVTAYIVGGGLHSIHEVLTIPSIRLGLIPGYEVDGKLAGNFNAFFQLFRNDSVIQNNLKTSWNKFINYVESEYPLIVTSTIPNLDEISADCVLNHATKEQKSTGCIIL